MGEYGNQYPEEIQEILNVMKSTIILSGGCLPEGIDAKQIMSLSEIPDDTYYEDFDDGRPVWRDIIATEASKFFCMDSNKWKVQNPDGRAIIYDIADDISSHIRSVVKDKFKKYCFDQEIAGFCKYLMYCRLVVGKTNKFFELLFNIYKSGGYPCGWEGYYPEGRLIVYYPNKPLR